MVDVHQQMMKAGAIRSPNDGVTSIWGNPQYACNASCRGPTS